MTDPGPVTLDVKMVESEDTHLAYDTQTGKLVGLQQWLHRQGNRLVMAVVCDPRVERQDEDTVYLHPVLAARDEKMVAPVVSLMDGRPVQNVHNVMITGGPEQVFTIRLNMRCERWVNVPIQVGPIPDALQQKL